jgi:hypothetical protein
MKVKLSLAAIVMAGFIIVASCGTTTGTAGSTSTANSAAYTAGQSFGSSLLGLYSSYKANGNKINFTDVNTLLQLAQLSMNIEAIKQNKSNTAFYGQFVQGAVLGSQRNITQNNAGSIINALTALNFGNIVQAAAGNGSVNSSTANSVTSTLSTLFGMFGK